MISFLKKDDEENEGGGFMGKQDIIFLSVIVVLVVGGWFYMKTIREHAVKHFTLCDSLYQASSFVEAEGCYQGARDLHYTNDSLDSIVYSATEFIDSLRERERLIILRIDSLVVTQDTARLQYLLEGLGTPRFASSQKIDSLSLLAKNLNVTPK